MNKHQTLAISKYKAEPDLGSAVRLVSNQKVQSEKIKIGLSHYNFAVSLYFPSGLHVS